MPAPTSLAFGADQTNDAALNAALAPGHLRHLPGVAQRRQRLHGPGVVVERPVGLRRAQRHARARTSTCSTRARSAWASPGRGRATSTGRSTASADRSAATTSSRTTASATTTTPTASIWRYVLGQVKAVAKVVSHLFYRAEDQMVYIADTGNGRVVKLAANSGTAAGAIVPRQDEAESWDMTGATLTEVVPRSAGLFMLPSGLEIHERTPLRLGQRHRHHPQAQARWQPAWRRCRPTPSQAAWAAWPSGPTSASTSPTRSASACCGSIPAF